MSTAQRETHMQPAHDHVDAADIVVRPAAVVTRATAESTPPKLTGPLRWNQGSTQPLRRFT
jgi:hypothetical protein